MAIFQKPRHCLWRGGFIDVSQWRDPAVGGGKLCHMQIVGRINAFGLITDHQRMSDSVLLAERCVGIEIGYRP